MIWKLVLKTYGTEKNNLLYVERRNDVPQLRARGSRTHDEAGAEINRKVLEIHNLK